VLSLCPQAALLLCVVSVLGNNDISQRFNHTSVYQIIMNDSHYHDYHCYKYYLLDDGVSGGVVGSVEDLGIAVEVVSDDLEHLFLP
jgi:hypothetical protein